MYRPSTWAVIAFLGSIACGRAESASCGLSSEDLAAIRDNQQSLIKALLAGDWNGAAAVHTEDAVRMPPGAGDERGRAAIQASLAQMERPSAITLKGSEIEGCGDLAYAWVTYSITWSSKGTERPTAYAGREMVILRKQPDGQWLASRVIFNSDKGSSM